VTTKKYILAHDVGTGGNKAVLCDLQGQVLYSVYQSYGISYPRPEWVEQDPDEWWDKGLECIKEVLKKKGDIDFITVTASSTCVIPVDSDGNCLMRAIMPSDKRAFNEAKHILELESFKKLPYRVDSYFVIPKILWIKNNLPATYNKTHKFLSPNDFLIYKLTNRFLTDELNATKCYTINNKYPKLLISFPPINRNSPLKRPSFYSSPGDNLSFSIISET